MKASLWITVALLSIARAFANDTVSELVDPRTHSVIQLAIEFQITKVGVSQEGSILCDVRATVHGRQLGFRLSIAQFDSQSVTAGSNREGEIEVMPDGSSTSELESLAQEKLGSSDSAESQRICGFYKAHYAPGSAIEDPLSIHLTHYGIVLLEGGKRVAGVGFAESLWLDIPMRKVTLYISEPHGYGSSMSKASHLRATLVPALIGANQSLEPTPTSGMPAADAPVTPAADVAQH